MKPTTARIRRGLDELHAAIYRERLPLRNLRMLPLGKSLPPQEIPIPSGDEPGWRPIAVGDHWGGQDENAWFHGEVVLPSRWRKLANSVDSRYATVLRLVLGKIENTDFGWPEGLLYLDGEFLQGINQHHIDLLLLPERLHSGTIAFDVRAWSGMLVRDHRLEIAEVALINRDIEALFHLLYASCDMIDALDENAPLLYALFSVIETTFDSLDLREPALKSLERSASQTLTELRVKLAILRKKVTVSDTRTITAIGHGHLDVAWLWQMRHTREKAARTFSIATALMKWYPEYYYLHTTPQVFAWLQQDYPHIFAEVKERVATRQIEAAGAMWVESDTNIVSGESLVRQILYGQRYLRETFGQEYDVLWLPDTFGYTASLPQIILKSGLKAIMTIKMSWRDTNRMPYDTFRWRGIDGSETLAHFVTTPWLTSDTDFRSELDNDTYSARFIVPAISRLWVRYRNKEHNTNLLLIYGHGDGGAGPTRQHLERYRALRELPGVPDIQLGRADKYFQILRDHVWGMPDLPVWDGEMYLEFHRGVYTSQSEFKRRHRRSEDLLLLAEYLDAILWARAIATGAVLADTRPLLDEFWRTLLLHEFHDILPGSSIESVYIDANAALTTLAQDLENFIGQTERALYDFHPQTSSSGSDWILFNPSPCSTPGDTSVAFLPLNAEEPLPTLTAAGHLLPAQEIIDREGARFALIETPPISGRECLTLRAASVGKIDNETTQAQSSNTLTAESTPQGGVILQNIFYRMELNEYGEIVSLIDKRFASGRELIFPLGVGNEFIAFEDRPGEFDAWDIDAGYTHKPYRINTASIRITERGLVRVTAHVTRKFQDSVIEQDISLFRSSSRIDFHTFVDWHERHLLLKVSFPLDLRTTQARSEIQFGSFCRPTHSNTTWDQARFETLAHRWVDISEGDYGVALLNDCLYGHDIHEHVVRLTILRSPTYPDPNADQGGHEMTFSLAPHLGPWPSGDVIAHGYALNRPLRALRGKGTPPASLFRVSDTNVILEAVKRAAIGDDLIVRLFEATGSRCEIAITCAYPISDVIETDLLERPLEPGGSPSYALWRASNAASHDAPITHSEGWSCVFRPFEIRTFRVRLRPADNLDNSDTSKG